MTRYDAARDAVREIADELDACIDEARSRQQTTTPAVKAERAARIADLQAMLADARAKAEWLRTNPAGDVEVTP